MNKDKMKYQRFSEQRKLRSESVLESDNVELFNRDTLYYGQNSWLNIIQEKRLQHKRDRKRLTIVFLSLIAFFSVLSIVFLLSAIINYHRTFLVDPDKIVTMDQEEYRSRLAFHESCRAIPPEERIDCNPDPPINQAICEKRGCCWNPVNTGKFSNYSFDHRSRTLPPINVPFCYFGADYEGYKIVEKHVGAEERHINIILQRVRASGYPNDVQNVQMDIFQLSDQVVRVKFSDRDHPRYEVPVPELNVPSSGISSKLYKVELMTNLQKLIIRRVSTGIEVFQVDLAKLIFADQMLQLTTTLPADSLYGLGEHREPFRKSTNWKRYTMFNRDQYPLPDMALYGSHPFYMVVEELHHNKDANGVFLFNSNAMDILTQPAPAITFRTIGGVLDFFIFMGPRPEDVVQQYHQLIGLPTMPPYWSLGFHLCRYGYRNFSTLNATFYRNVNEGIPMDVQWTDIDMMRSNNDFTYDQERFKGLSDFIENVLHKNNMKFIPMFDAGISAGEAPSTYLPYELGVQMNVFVKNHTGQIFRGKVWNSKSTVWPDFFHQNATAYWSKLFQEYHKQIPFDGAWIDMNEPSNFLDGQELVGCPLDNDDLRRYEEPQYTPGKCDDSLTLRHKTLCMTAKHYNDELHYNLHNLYGMKQAIVTNEALRKTLAKEQRRPFIISRSSAPGHGHWAYHWDGDIVSDWPSMKWSISSILNFQLFGIPMVGADICGFNGNTTEELCARWHQLGAFYTFARNHNSDDTIEQDAAALGPRVIQAAKNALLLRYAHLPYLYTLFFDVHLRGGTVLRPLFFEFPHDETSYKIDDQFMWGRSIMIAPVLSPKMTKNDVYFPKGSWYYLEDYKHIRSKGQFLTMNATLSFPNVYYRSGSILPLQSPKETTDRTRRGNFHLILALESSHSEAKGHLYWDEGDGVQTIEQGQYNLYDFMFKDRLLSIESKHLGYETNQVFQEITVLGFEKGPDMVEVNDKSIRFKWENNQLILQDLNLDMFNRTSLPLLSKVQHRIYFTFNGDLD